MGHDPSPHIEIAGGRILVWPDGAEDGPTGTGEPIEFSRDEFRGALDRVQQDLDAFVLALRRWIDAHVPSQAAAFAGSFRRRFVVAAADQTE